MPASPLLALLLVTTLACGGGGGSAGNTPQSEPTPRPSPVRPIETPGPGRSSAEVILRDGDLIGEDLVVANIEDAALGSGSSVAVVVTIANEGNRSAIVRREAGRAFTTAYDPRIDDAVADPTSIGRLRLAPDGEMVFQAGGGLDSDRLYRIVNGVVETLAGGPPGPEFPDFRILGNVRLGTGGVVAFVGGGGPCEVVVGDDAPRVTCTNALYVADASGVQRLDDAELQLARQRATAIRVELDPAGGAWFSLPRRAAAPMLLHHLAGETTAVLTGESEVGEIGLLNSLEAVAVNAAGQVLLEVGPREFSGERRPEMLGILAGDDFDVIVRDGDTLGDRNVASLRGIGLDGAGRALFEAQLGPTDDPSAQRSALWLGDALQQIELVREGSALPGDQAIVLNLLGSRVNAAGDVAFVTELGTISDGVLRREEVRATVRRADGRLVTIASTLHSAQFGALSDMQIVGYDEAGTLLLIGTRGRSSDRVLLLGRSDQTPG